MTPTRCEDRQEAITALVMGEIGAPEAAELLEHLQACSECMALYEEMDREEAFLQATLPKAGVGAEGPLSVHFQLAHVPDNESIVPPASDPRMPAAKARWRRHGAVLAAAGLLLAAVGLFSWLSFNSISYGAVFGDVMRQIGSARSVTYTITVQKGEQKAVALREIATDSGRIISNGPNGVLRLYDFVSGNDLAVYPAKRTARFVHVARHNRAQLSSYLTWLETLHEKDGKWVGLADLDGRKTNVFSVSRPFEQITVWADVQTDLPVRVELAQMPCLDKDIRIPQMSFAISDFENADDPEASSSALGSGEPEWTTTIEVPGVCREKGTVTVTDLAWNVPVDESLFQVKVPEGYWVDKVDYGDPPPREQALIASLRLWAEACEGAFPADINGLLDCKPLLIEKLRGSGSPEQAYAQAVKIGYVILTGSLFAQTLKTVDNWHYAGQDVKLGQADRPLCWWKNEDPATGRVIYGDLSIRDVPAADLPTSVHP
jgi:hypothetical protein